MLPRWIDGDPKLREIPQRIVMFYAVVRSTDFPFKIKLFLLSHAFFFNIIISNSFVLMRFKLNKNAALALAEDELRTMTINNRLIMLPSG